MSMGMGKADETRQEAVVLMMVLVDLAEYTQDDLIEMVEEVIERTS